MTVTKSFTAGSHAFTFRASAVPTMRTNRLLDYLMSVGYSDADLTSFLKPVLQRWEEPAAVFRVLKENGFKAEVKPLEKLLRGLFDTSVKAWYEQVIGGDEENTPARELADEVDYWNLYAKKFGKALLKVRAILHDGVVWFRLGDVAGVAGSKTFDTHVTNYVSRLPGFKTLESKTYKNVQIRKTTKAVRLFTRRELHVIDDRSTDEGTRKGDWYVTQKGMEFIIATSADKTPQAAAFLDHVLEVLHGRAENMAQHAEKKIAVRSAARNRQLEEYPFWDENNRAHGASTIRSNGEVFYHVTEGKYTTQAAYCAKHGVGKPFAKNLPDGIIQKTNLVRGMTMALVNEARPHGQHEYEKLIADAASAATLLRKHPKLVSKLAASQGIHCKPRSVCTSRK